MAPVPRPLCVLGVFQPFGCSVEHLPHKPDNALDSSLSEDLEDARATTGAYSYFLFDPALARNRSSGPEDSVLWTSCGNHDEEIFIHGNTVVWSAGRQVRKRFSGASAVVQAVWCRFNCSREPLLCVLHSDSLTTFTPAGDMNIVPLPHVIASIWPLPCGLLLQRAVDGFGYGLLPSIPKTWNHEGFRDVTAGPGTGGKRSFSVYSPSEPYSLELGFSTISHFTLQHPLEEPQALQSEEAGKSCNMVDLEERIIWTSSDVPYAASYHTAKMQHSIWKIKLVHVQKDSNISSANMKCPQSCDLERGSRICLQRVWQDEDVQSMADGVFLANDNDGLPILCFLLKASERLISFRLLKKEATGVKFVIAWTIPANAAAPVVATRPWSRQSAKQFDLIILAPDRRLFLHSGQYPLCELYLPWNDISHSTLVSGANEMMLIDQHMSCDGEGHVVSLSDPVQGRVNVVTSSGQVYRCAVCLPPASGLTTSCVIALDEGLNCGRYNHLIVSLWERSSLCSIDLARSDGGAGGIPDIQWATFADLVMHWCMKVRAVQTQKDLETSSDWGFLLKSTMHRKNKGLYGSICLQDFSSISKPLFQRDSLDMLSHESQEYSMMLMELLSILHTVYEDRKLDSLRWRELQPLSALLGYAAASLKQWNYLDHYARDFPELLQLLIGASFEYKEHALNVPFNVFHWLEICIRGKEIFTFSKRLPSIYAKEDSFCVSWSKKVIAFYELLSGREPIGGILPSGVHIHISSGSFDGTEQMLVLAMVGEGFGLSELDRLPSGVSIPLRHALNSCREAPPSDWPESAFVLVGREDLASMQAERRVESNATVMAAPYMLHLRPVMSCTNNLYDGSETESISTEEVVNDGMEHMFNSTIQLRFGCDLRMNEVRRLLGSSRPVAVRMANPPDVSDPDIVAQQQAQLLQLAQRTTALPFGRGAFTLATMHTLLTEALPIPKLVLAGRLPSQHDATVNLDAATTNLSDLTAWPEFHNGVAAGLRLAPCQDKVTRTWIVYNKPDEPSYAHAGLLMSLGLHRHLRVLAATDVYRYLSQEHEATTVGILLGMAAAYWGTMDPAISKMLYLHIPARHPPSFPELELPTLMQSAALMAVGMLYQGSAHRLTTEILLAEVGRKPGGDNALEREGYALAAGLALGLVTLGKGKSAWGLADLSIEERLLLYMSGGTEPGEGRQQRADGPMSSLFSNNSKNLEDMYQNNGQVMEGPMVNLDVTAPGATLALGLMFLKSNSEEVAARLAIPDTHFALEYVRPDFILLRIVARSLILWDSVEPNENWVQAQIPVRIKEALTATQKEIEDSHDTIGDVDIEALAQAHVNIIAGACLSIGLRYAGSSSLDAQQLLYRYALYFLKEKRSAAPFSGSVGPNGRFTYVDRGTLETCLNVAILAMSVVMAGSGHLGTFKLLRYLRRRNDADGSSSYGNHMAISMAMGFLFLGRGTLTFATNNNAVAALLISMYPRFPTTPNDHRCHLQAFRHLYVLATEARCVQTIDVDTGLPVYVPLEITIQETHAHAETTFFQVSPCVFPERSLLKRVRVCGPRYWPQDIKVQSTDHPWWQPSERGNPFIKGVIYVKRKVGARSYGDDPIGCRSLLSHTLQKILREDSTIPIKNTNSNVDQIVSTFSADPSLLAFAQIFCHSHDIKLGNDFEDFCSQALLECVSSDKRALLEAYLSFYCTVEVLRDNARGHSGTLSNFCSRSLSLCSLKVALAYNEAVGSGSLHLRGGPLVQQTFLAALAKRVDDVLSFHFFPGIVHMQNTPIPLVNDILTYVDLVCNCRTDIQWKTMQNPFLLTCYLCWYNIPYPALLYNVIKQLSIPGVSFMRSDAFSNLPLLAMLLPGTAFRTLLQVNQFLCCRCTS